VRPWRQIRGKAWQVSSRDVSQSIANFCDRLWLFLPRFVYNASVRIDAAHRATFIVEKQLRINLTVYLTVIVDFFVLHSSKNQILTAPVNHRVGIPTSGLGARERPSQCPDFLETRATRAVGAFALWRPASAARVVSRWSSR
jgi:hypothetical protein